MNVAILDASVGGGRDVSNSYMVAYRNLAVLKSLLGADLFINPEDIRFDKDYDVIICGFGSTSCEKELSTKFLLQNSKARIFWLIGDYEQSTFAPLFYSKRQFEVICTFGDYKIKNKMMTNQNVININALLTLPPNKPIEKKYDCIYYGRWRPDRLDYFKQYLDSRIHLSTASKNMKLFHHNGCNPKMVNPLSWAPRRESLNLYRSSLYIEDKFSHQFYTCLGNRFYESLWCNNVPLIDRSCIGTMEKSGYSNFDWHIVDNMTDVINKCNEIKEGYTGALESWQKEAMIESSNVKNEIKRLIYGN
jgi:hypothetical protein